MSVFVVLLAVAPGINQRVRKGNWGDYDPGISVLTVTLIAVIWTAHYTYRAVRHAKHVERREDLRRVAARQALCTAVMGELYYLEPSLALMHARIEVKGVRFLERPQVRHALTRSDLFSPATAYELARFDSILHQIESHAALYSADHASAEDDALTHGIGTSGVPVLKFDPQRIESIRTMIAAAQKLIPILDRTLLRES